MAEPSQASVVSALAAFVRRRLTDTLGELGSRVVGRRSDTELLAAIATGEAAFAGPSVAAARQLALVVVGATAPFAPTSYARARLIRQLHASGTLADDRTLTLGQDSEMGRRDVDAIGAPRAG